MMRFASTACGLAMLISTGLPATYAAAEDVTFASASPYQLGDLIGTADPAYDVEIDADLVYPEGATDALPAFVFLHGSGGKLLRHHRYLELARRLGFVTLQIDSFGPRGVGSTVGNQTNVTAAMMTIDLLRGLKFLAGKPDIDSEKIIVMGSSKGAVAALYAAWTPIREKVIGDLDFAGYVLLYPLCTAIEDAKVTANPVHVYIGELDNWTPATPCVGAGLGDHPL